MYIHDFRKYALVTHIDLFSETEDGKMEVLGGVPDDNPIIQSLELHQTLRSGALSQEDPFIYRDEFEVYFAAIKAADSIYYLGPMSAIIQDRIALRQFYHHYEIQPEDVRQLRIFSLQEILSIIELLVESLTGKTYQELELFQINHIIVSDTEMINREQTIFNASEESIDDREETWRHTYREERKLMDAMREGYADEAIRLNRLLDDDTGRLASKDFYHWRSLAIIGIALCVRAAIDGGLSPENAYRLSGYYIRRCNDCQTVTQILHVRDYAIRDFANQVKKKKEHSSTSNYTETCKNYVAKHYREKIYLNDIADTLGITPTYLSRLFKQDTGMRLQDYINLIRVNRAANLLKYSDNSLTEIAEYVNFPSQSYFGKIFREHMHMTPKKYRDLHKPSEWNQPTMGG